MKFAIVSIFPEMFKALTDYGVIGRAVKEKIISVELFNPRDFAEDAYRRVDDRPFGGGPGMVMMAEPLYCAVDAAKKKLGPNTKVIYLSPQGQRFKQEEAASFLHFKKVILICGRYEGVDQRFIEECVDMECSIGDFVVSGGELPAMLVIDAMTRLVPGVLRDEETVRAETFQGETVDYPQYTMPRMWHDKAVPEVLLSGDHRKIKEWREKVVQIKK